MPQNVVLQQLTDKVAACSSGKFVDYWQLLQFFDQISGVEIYEALCHELTTLEPNLTEPERDEMRRLGHSFYDELESPIKFLTRNDNDDGLLSNG